MDYSGYQKETVSKLDIIGSYIVDLYYNRLYNKAINLKETSGKSITESYRYVVSTYINHIDTVDFYKTFLHGIYFYTTISTKYQNMTHKQCLDFFVTELVPTQYLNSMTEVQKNNVMFMILKNSLSKFTTSVLNKYISMIIDDHLDADNIPILQDEFLKIILIERDHTYNQFINTERKNIEKDDSHNIKLLKEELSNKKKLILSIDMKNKQLETIMNHHKQCINELKTHKAKLLKSNKMNKELKEMITIQIGTFKKVQEDLDAKIITISKLEEEIEALQSELDNYRARKITSQELYEVQEPYSSHKQKTQPEEDIMEFNGIPTTEYLSDEE
jgi:hypothetical protein